MPRIEIMPEKPPRNPHDGSPTIDVCMSCVEDFNERENVPHAVSKEFGRNAVVVTIGVEHPPYSEELGEYECHVCGTKLTDDDNDPETGTIEVRKL